MTNKNWKPVDETLPWDTADYLRDERLLGLEENCRVDDGDDREDPPEPHGTWLAGDVTTEEMENYSQVITIPGPLLTSEIVELWRRIHNRIRLGLPAETDGELVIRATRSEIIAQGLGKKVCPGALLIGTLLAVGKAEGVRIETHPRDLAKDLSVRYQTLLTVKRIALAQIKRHGARLGLTVE